MPPQVQENRNQNQPSAKPADPFDNPVEYVRAHGFKPLGNPDWPTCLWLDTNRPIFGEEKKVEKKAHFLRQDPNNPKKIIAVLEPVMANDGTLKHSPVKQIVFTPPAEPMTLQDALRHCMELDHKKLMDAERARAKQAVA